MATPAQVEAFIDKIAPLAVAECKKRGYGNAQAWTCVAQACCETGYGTSALMMKANACFGIKATSAWNGKVFSSKTKECYDGKTYTDITAAFRAYDNVADSIRDYFDFIEGKRYRDSLTKTTVKDCITVIKNGGYATSPTYINTIVTIYEKNKSHIEQYRVEGRTMGIFSPLCTDIYDFGTSHSNPRSQDGITQPTKIIPHHMAGIMDALECAKMHKRTSKTNGASANCFISDDKIVGAVSEDRRAWTSGGTPVGGKSGRWADFRAITIEVSNNKKGVSGSEKGWTISDKSYRSLVRYCADVCNRYGIIPHYDGTQTGTLVMHQQFSKTGCPGEHLKDLIMSHQLETDILKEMGKKPDTKPDPQSVRFRVQIGAFKSLANAESYAKTFSTTGKTKGLTALVKKEGVYYKVQHPSVGFDTKADAELSAGALKQMGYPKAFVVAGN